MMKKICLAVAATIALSACTTNPYTGERETSKAAIGSGLGALAGAVIGGASASSSDRKKGILIGAASGAALGGGVGYYMDVQEAKLRDQMRGTGVGKRQNCKPRLPCKCRSFLVVRRNTDRTRALTRADETGTRGR